MKKRTSRTADLTATNAELQLQDGLLQHLPISAWTLKPDGTPDFVNQVWLEYSGQTLDYVRSHPEAWMTAVHPEDREAASKSFWDGVRSGLGFAMETRSLRARDRTYRWHLNQAVPLRDAAGKVLKFIGTTTDIDDQKRALEVLRASESSLRQILDNIPALVCTFSASGVSEHVSRRTLEYFGKTQEELISWEINDTVHPDDLPRIAPLVIKSLATGTSFEDEIRYRRADGVYRWFKAHIVPVRNTNGNIDGFYALITDIEDRKRADEKLRQEQKELKRSEVRKTAILNSALDCIVTIDHEGRITEFNPAAEQTFGYRRDEVVGRSMADVIIPPTFREMHRQGFARYLATGEARVLGKRVEMTAVRADGSEFLVELTITRTPLDGPPSFTGYLRDITEHRRNENALHAAHAQVAQSEERWRLVFENSAIGVVLADLDGRFLAANPVYEQMLGYTEEELQKLSFLDITHEEDLELNRKLIGELLAGKRQQFQIEKQYRRKDGSLIWVRNNVSLVPGTERVPQSLMALSEDVTERKRAEEALAQVRSELAHVSRVTTLGAMTASIAHEVNQPLSGILTNASTCTRMLAHDPPNIEGARETVRRLIRDGNRMAEVISRLRALFSKKDAAIESMNLNEAVLEVIALCIVDLQKNRVVLRPELPDDLPLVKGDRVQLQQVILNLLRNGSDAMSTVEDRPRQLVITTERDEGDRVRLTVQDAGVGFDPQVVNRLFDPFYTTKGEGMGIGLSVSRYIIESHHGRMWATLNDGPGAAFSFSIPRAPEGLARADGSSNVQPSATTGSNAA
jgi:PAS domain S-box-containing protein